MQSPAWSDCTTNSPSEVHALPLGVCHCVKLRQQGDSCRELNKRYVWQRKMTPMKKLLIKYQKRENCQWFTGERQRLKARWVCSSIFSILDIYFRSCRWGSSLHLMILRTSIGGSENILYFQIFLLWFPPFPITCCNHVLTEMEENVWCSF